jgi:hypothetical protein
MGPDLCDLTVEVPRGQTPTQEFGTEPVNATGSLGPVALAGSTSPASLAVNAAARISSVRRGSGRGAVEKAPTGPVSGALHP